MGRILGIDFGKKRIGLAISDPLGMFATGFQTLEFTSEKRVLRELQEIIAVHDVELLVLGLPLRSTGEMGDTAEAVQAFGALLSEKTGLSVIYEDERFTSVIAQRSLREQGIQPSRKKHLIDQTSAALILQQHLDKRSSM